MSKVESSVNLFFSFPGSPQIWLNMDEHLSHTETPAPGTRHLFSGRIQLALKHGVAWTRSSKAHSFPNQPQRPASAPHSSLPAAFSFLHLQGPQAEHGEGWFSPGWRGMKFSWDGQAVASASSLPRGVTVYPAGPPGSAAQPLSRRPRVCMGLAPSSLCILDLSLLLWPLTPPSAQTSSVIRLFCPHLRSVLIASTVCQHHTNAEGQDISCGQLSG